MLFALKIAVMTVGAGVSLYLLRVVAQNKRRLDRRIAEFKAEQEAQSGPPPNPYLALAELYAEDERKNREARQRRRKAE